MVDAGDRQAGIESNEIGEFKWTHRLVCAQFHCGVDFFYGRNSFHQDKHSLIDHRDENPIHDKAGIIVPSGNGCFADFVA